MKSKVTGSELERLNIHDAPLHEVVAHGGVGTIRMCRVAEDDAKGTACNFIDVAVIPPGASVGRHRHGAREEEFYLILEGEGTMHRDGAEFRVRPGDLIRNRAGGEHGLVNDGARDLKFFVFELKYPAGAR